MHLSVFSIGSDTLALLSNKIRVEANGNKNNAVMGRPSMSHLRLRAAIDDESVFPSTSKD